MKKVLVLLLVVGAAWLPCFCLSTQAASDPIVVLLNGEQMSLEVDPILVDSRVLVPMRAIFEALGAEVEYDGNHLMPDGNKADFITGIRGRETVNLMLGSTNAFIGDTLVQLDVPPTVSNNRIMVPLRFVAEALKANVYYESLTRAVYVNFTDGMKTIVWDNGNYKGSVVNGMPDGYGTYDAIDTNSGILSRYIKHYDGQWKAGHIEGKGTGVFQIGGEVYSGEWKNDGMNGFGVKITMLNSKIEGRFSEGMFKDGTITYPNGDKFVGVVNDDQTLSGKITKSTGETIFIDHNYPPYNPLE